ncbi:MAG: hypothetical protein AB7U92_00625 [Piscinibacter sp.]|uniref:InlB B-repeat-containing protein n=1 Tax=Piscinibacter sp. TaxID=1903157 RepID=UPI003D12A3E8
MNMLRSGLLHTLALVAVLLTLGLVAGCGGGSSGPSTVTIGAAGGSASGPDGAGLDVPAGALAADAAVAIERDSRGAPALPAGMSTFGPTYAFTPHGTTFAVAVSVRVPYDAASVPAGAAPALYKTNAAGAWERVAGATAAAGIVTAQVTSFSWFVVGNLAPTITTQPADASVVEPATASFRVVAIGTPPFTYQWQRSDDGGANFSDIAGATADRYTTPPTGAAADDGARFRVRVANLEGSSLSQAARLSVTAAAAATATLTVTVTPPSSGTVTSIPGGIDCGSDCSQAYTLDTVVALTPTPAAGFTFSGWSGSGCGASVTMSAARTCTATFSPVTTGLDLTGTWVSSYRCSGSGGSFSGQDTLTVTQNGTSVNFTSQSDGATFTGTLNGSTLTYSGGLAGSYTETGTWSLQDANHFTKTSTYTRTDGSGGSCPGTGQRLGAAAAQRIAAGADFSLARLADGSVVSWGSDASGTLGAGPGDQSRNVPGGTPLSNVATIGAGVAHGLAIVANGGGLRGWGYNGFGQLSDSTNLSRESPVTPPFNHPEAVEVCGGSLHSLLRRADGVLRAFGANMNGQIGDGTFGSSAAPPYSVLVSGITDATAIACGGNHSLALLADGTVRAWGANGAGQLGDGTTTDRNAPVAVAGLSQVIAIAAGTDHSLALRSDGSVWAWGSNANGKLGDGSSTDRPLPTATLLTSGITAIAAGGMNSLALRGVDGVVLAWGINETGQLGSGSLVPGFRTQPAPVINLSNVVAIAFGRNDIGHGLAVSADGTVWAWGDNRMGNDNSGRPVYGKLGHGSSEPFSATPVPVSGLNLN